MKLSSELEMDFSFQQDNMYRRMRRLICFDMDSTLIETEVIDELAIRAGVGDESESHHGKRHAWKNRLYRELYPSRSLIEGVGRIGNAGNSQELAYHRGCRATDVCIEEVRLQDRHLSGGFTYFGQYLQKKYGIDYVYANELEIIDGKLTGRYLGDVVDGKRKAELLRLIAQVERWILHRPSP